MSVLFRALLVCSDDGCEAAEVELIAPLEEIEAMACDCGLGLHVLAWPEPWEDVRTRPAA